MDISTKLVSAVAHAWREIQKRNPDTPDVVITVGAGARIGGLVLGHFAPHRWARGDDSIHELFVGGEGLERGAASVMATLIHEAAHGIAVTRDVQDVSRNGRYHNTTFRDIAEPMGIALTFTAGLGWSNTELSAAGQRSYGAAIKRLDTAIVAYRKLPEMVSVGGGVGGLPTIPMPTKGRGRPSNNNGLSLHCACERPRRIRVADTTAELGPILCGICGSEFI